MHTAAMDFQTASISVAAKCIGNALSADDVFAALIARRPDVEGVEQAGQGDAGRMPSPGTNVYFAKVRNF